MWYLGTWLNGGLNSAGLTFGLDGLGDLFQPFYDSMILLSKTRMEIISRTAPRGQAHSMNQEFEADSSLHFCAK